MKKSNTLSTDGGSKNSVVAPNVDRDNSVYSDDISPVKWGFLAAGIVHILNVIPALWTSAPWACLHGSANLCIAIPLFIAVFKWDKCFNSNLYVRQQLLRISIVNAAIIAGLMIGHGVLAGLFNRVYILRDCRPTTYGCLRKVPIYPPIIDSIILGLWASFIYIQWIAVENLRLASPVGPENVSINEEMRNSAERAALDKKASENERYTVVKIAYGIVTSVTITFLNIVGFLTSREFSILSVFAFLGSTVLSVGFSSIKLRTSWWGSLLFVLCMCGSVASLGASFKEGSEYLNRGGRIGLSSGVLVMEAGALLMWWWRKGTGGEEDLKNRRKAGEHFLRRNDKQEVVEDPIVFFMHGVAAGEP